jgi:hypothetical protein
MIRVPWDVIVSDRISIDLPSIAKVPGPPSPTTGSSQPVLVRRGDLTFMCGWSGKGRPILSID